MDVSSASSAIALQSLSVVSQISTQAIEQMMNQELALIEAMAGAAPTVASPPPGVGTQVDISA